MTLIRSLVFVLESVREAEGLFESQSTDQVDNKKREELLHLQKIQNLDENVDFLKDIYHKLEHKGVKLVKTFGEI